MTQATMQASVRFGAGKGSARATRRNGHVPAVIYGNNEKPLLISLDKNKLEVRLQHSGFMSHLLTLEIDGKNHIVLPRDVQLDPVSDQPLHADFLRVTDKTEIRVAVPLLVDGGDKSPGIKRGGALNIVSHELELYCLAGSIPEAITVNAGALDIGDSIHLGQVTLPKGVRLINEEESEMTLITITAPTAMREEARAAAEAKNADAAAAAAPAAAGKAAPAAAAKPAAKKK